MGGGLNVVIRGGDAVVGRGGDVILSVENSEDPDGEPGLIAYEWWCKCTSAGAGSRACRDSEGQLLPSRMTNETLHLTLQGAEEGGVMNYTFTVTASKGARTSQRSTPITVLSTPPLSMVITPVVGKVNPTEPLALQSEVTSEDPASLHMVWSCTLEPEGQAFPLTPPMLLSPVTQENIVLREHVLTEGHAYRFQLSAHDRLGAASAAITVVMNSPPTGGGVVVRPTEGVALSTVFTIIAPDWRDDDPPLTFQQLYRVVGAGTNSSLQEEADEGWRPLVSDHGPLGQPPQLEAVLPEAGIALHGDLVQVCVSVMDAYGATATAETSVTVRTAAVLDAAPVLGRVDRQIMNGDTDAAMRDILGLSADLNRRSNELAHLQSIERRMLGVSAQGETSAARATLLEGVAALHGSFFPTSGSVASLAEMARGVLAVPYELTNQTQALGLQLVESLIADTAEGKAQMKAGTAITVLEALSSLNEANQSATGTAGETRAAVAAGDVAASTSEGIARSAECQALATQLSAAVLVGAVDGEVRVLSMATEAHDSAGTPEKEASTTVAASGTDAYILFILVFGIIGTAALLGTLSTWQHSAERQSLLEALVTPYGTGALGCRQIYGQLWTWGVFEEEVHFPGAKLLSKYGRRWMIHSERARSVASKKHFITRQLTGISCAREEKRARGGSNQDTSASPWLDRKIASNLQVEGLQNEHAHFVRTPTLQRALGHVESSSRNWGLAHALAQSIQKRWSRWDPTRNKYQASGCKEAEGLAAERPRRSRRTSSYSAAAPLLEAPPLRPSVTQPAPACLRKVPHEAPQLELLPDARVAGQGEEAAPTREPTPSPDREEEHQGTAEEMLAGDSQAPGGKSEVEEEFTRTGPCDGSGGHAGHGSEERDHPVTDLPSHDPPMATRAILTTSAKRLKRAYARMQTVRNMLKVSSVNGKGVVEQEPMVAREAGVVGRKTRLKNAYARMRAVHLMSRVTTSNVEDVVDQERLVVMQKRVVHARSGEELWEMLRVRLRGVCPFICHLLKMRDLRSTAHLCDFMRFSPTMLALHVPIDALRDAKARTAAHMAIENVVPPSPAESQPAPERAQQQPVERLLGTALVLAFLNMHSIVQVNNQLQVAKRVNWAQPHVHLGIEAYIGLFKAMLSQSRDMLLQSALWNLALLQDAEGGFDLTDALARALHAGANTVALLSISAVPAGCREDVLAVLPQELRQAGEAQGLSEQRVMRLWATMLAVAKMRLLPISLVWNPEAEVAEQQSVSSQASAYIRKVCAERPGICAAAVEAESRAEAVVYGWHRTRMDAMARLRQKEYLGCHSALEQQPCWGALTCQELYQARDAKALPEHLAAEGFECTAFPSNDRVADRVWVAIIVVGIMFPVNQALQLLFTHGGAPQAPRHIVYVAHHSSSSPTSRVIAWLEGLLVLLEPDPSSLSRTIAPLFLVYSRTSHFTYMGLRGLWLRGRHHLQQLCTLTWLIWQLFAKGEDQQVVLQRNHDAWKAKEQEDARRRQLIQDFAVIQGEMDHPATRLIYLGVISGWAMILWLQVTYASEVRSMLGAAEERLVIREWLLTIVVDKLIIHAFLKIALLALSSFLLRQYNDRKMVLPLTGCHHPIYSSN
eukprot:gene2966-3782_t